MKLEIDEVDFSFITYILYRAETVFEELGHSNDICSTNRNRFREDAKMAQQAREMMYAAMAKKEGGEE